MARSVIRSYQHLVWATSKRQPLLTAQVEPIILASFAATCERLDLELLAANGAWDHVHLLVRWSGAPCDQGVVGELKSRAWRACREAAEEDPLLPAAPRWQRGYAVSSIREGRSRRCGDISGGRGSTISGPRRCAMSWSGSLMSERRQGRAMSVGMRASSDEPVPSWRWALSPQQ